MGEHGDDEGSEDRLTSDGGSEDWLTTDELGSLWVRWTDQRSDMHLHRVCEVVPQVTLKRSPPYYEVTDEAARPEAEPPSFTPPGEDEPVQFQFISGVPRFLLRHVPLVILLAAVALFGAAEFTPGIDGLSVLIPTIEGPDAGLFVLYLAITPFLIYLLSTVDVVQPREFPKAAVIYGLIAGLVAGVAVSMFLVLTADHPSLSPPNVVYVSGYLLLLLVAGQLLYEATLRIEHLFVKLPERDSDIVADHEAYAEWLADLNDRLSRHWLSPSRIFGVLFAGQFAIIWIIGNGPQNLDSFPGLVVNSLFNAVLATVTFQFLVVVRYFNHLLSDDPTYGPKIIQYEPFHVDGHGGFRDFGRFATRINVILSIAGLYLVYRLYVVGGRGLPVDGIMSVSDPLQLAVWLLSFVGPVVAYALGAGAWGYYSFWSMHVKMVRDKHRFARQYQGTNRDIDVDRTPAAGDRISSFDDSEGPAWAALQSAPTWPLDVNKMASLLSGNLLPLLLPVSNLVF